MPWWSWLLLGCAFMGFELAIDAAFYLLFAGVAAMLIGLVIGAGVPLPEWAQWLGFSALAVITIVMFRRDLYEAFRRQAPGFEAELKSETVALETDLEPGARGRVKRAGSRWTVLNVGDTTIPAGMCVHIKAVRGIVLEVEGSATADIVN